MWWCCSPAAIGVDRLDLVELLQGLKARDLSTPIPIRF